MSSGCMEVRSKKRTIRRWIAQGFAGDDSGVRAGIRAGLAEHQRARPAADGGFVEWHSAVNVFVVEGDDRLRLAIFKDGEVFLGESRGRERRSFYRARRCW